MLRSAVYTLPLGCHFGSGQKYQRNKHFLRRYTSVRSVTIRDPWLNANTIWHIDHEALPIKADENDRVKNNIVYLILRMITELDVAVMILY